jgi:hypothetical protein
VNRLNANSERRTGAYAYDEAERIAEAYLAGDSDKPRAEEQPWIEPPEEVPESEYWKVLLDASRRAFPELVRRLVDCTGRNSRAISEDVRVKLLFDLWKAVHDRVRGGPMLNMTLQAEGMPAKEETTEAWAAAVNPDIEKPVDH